MDANTLNRYAAALAARRRLRRTVARLIHGGALPTAEAERRDLDARAGEVITATLANLTPDLLAESAPGLTGRVQARALRHAARLIRGAETAAEAADLLDMQADALGEVEEG